MSTLTIAAIPGDGIGNVIAAILGGARYSQKQITRTHLTAVQGQFTNQD